jgi:cytochrome c556
MKFTLAVQALSALSIALLTTAFAPADDDSPLQKVMEGLNTRSIAIKRKVASAAVFDAVDKKILMDDVTALGKLGKEARAFSGEMKTESKTETDWTRAADELIRSSDELTKLLREERPPVDRVQSSFRAIQKSCTKCHATFRSDD